MQFLNLPKYFWVYIGYCFKQNTVYVTLKQKKIIMTVTAGYQFSTEKTSTQGTVTDGNQLFMPVGQLKTFNICTINMPTWSFNKISLMLFANWQNTELKDKRKTILILLTYLFLRRNIKRTAEWRIQLEKNKNRLILAWQRRRLSLSWVARALLECLPWWWCRSWEHLLCRRPSQRLRWKHPSPAARPSPGSGAAAPRSPCSWIRSEHKRN